MQCKLLIFSVNEVLLFTHLGRHCKSRLMSLEQKSLGFFFLHKHPMLNIECIRVLDKSTVANQSLIILPSNTSTVIKVVQGREVFIIALLSF